MDHLPKVEEPFHADLEIPLYVKSGQGYEGMGVEDFLSFPSQQGYDLQRLKFGDFGEKTFEDVMSFVQAWGYFGMMREVLQVCDLDFHFQFPVGGDTGRYTCTVSKMLPDLTRIWYDHEERADAATKAAHSEAVSQVTLAVRNFVAGITHQEFCGGIFSSSTKVLDEDEESMKLSDTLKMLREGDSHSHEFGMIITSKYYELNRNFYTDETGWEVERIKIDGEDWNLGRIGSKAHQVMLSIIILGETLTNAASVIYEDFENFRWPSTPLVSILMECVGWCPFQVSQLGRERSNSHLYYLSFFNQKKFSKSHRNCCKDYCLAYQVDEKTYQTRHVKEDCKCTFISFDEQFDDVSKWIELGQTPLVKRQISSLGEETQKNWCLAPSQEDKVARYVCISHVWGDGMGNPFKNSLPECQLDKIQDAVNAVLQSDCDVPFWIDTISIPLRQPLRQHSIRSMAKTYREAQCVLVIDNTLIDFNADASVEEILSRVEVSGWMTRLWTLSEGVNASALYFQLRQRAVMIEELRGSHLLRQIEEDCNRIRNKSRLEKDTILGVLTRQMQGIASNSSSELTRAQIANIQLDKIYFSVSAALGQMRMLREAPEDQLEVDYRFYQMILILNRRDTSKREDEPICIASLLGIDVQPMLEMDSESRMLSLLLSHSHLIPAGIIFGKKARVQKPGCRWAPLSLMQPDFNWSGKAEKITDEGIHAYYSAISLHPYTSTTLGAHFGLKDCSSGARYLVDIHDLAEDMGILIIDTLYIIIERPLGQISDTKGLLVNVSREEDGCMFAELVTPILIRDVSGRKTLLDHECLSTDPIVPNRLWCIG